MRNWTCDQLKAISARGNVLVAAAAGAGKTSVLVERVMCRLRDEEHPLDVDRLLVVTFTKAAASKMRDEIAQSLRAELRENPNSDRLRRQLLLLNRADIDTLHGFCLRLLRRHFYRLGLDPAFRVIEEAEAVILKKEAAEEVLEAAWQEGRPEYLALFDSYGGQYDDSALADLVIELYDFARSLPRPMAWLDEMVKALAPERLAKIEDAPFFGVLTSETALILNEALALLERALVVCEQPEGPAAYYKVIADEVEGIRACLEALATDWDAAYAAASGLEFGRLPAVKGSSPLKDEVKRLRDKAKKLVSELKEDIFYLAPERQLEELKQAYPLLEALAGLVKDFDRAYRRVKERRGALDFTDLEHLALKLLAEDVGGEMRPSALAAELREAYDEVLVDEYQDIGGVEEAILSLISRQGGGGLPNLYLVGDVKQSIYRFRLADPGLFLSKYRRFSRQEGERERLITLRHNFRCRPGIVKAVNYVFRRLMTPEVGEMRYDEEAMLVAGRDVEREEEKAREQGLRLLTDEVELIVVDRSSSGESEEPENEREGDREAAVETGEDAEGDSLADVIDATRLEARVIASRIRELVDGGYCVWDDRRGEMRPLAYRDMAVLLRAAKTPAGVIVEEMRSAGIPVYCELTSGFFGAWEVNVVLSLLKVIDNPDQDIPLLAVLRSPIGGLRDEDLAAIRIGCRHGSYYQAVREAAKVRPDGNGGDGLHLTLAPEMRERLSRLMCEFERWRVWAGQEPLDVFIWRLMRETGFYDWVGGLPGGEERQANLRLLAAWAAQYDDGRVNDLSSFLAFIDEMRREGQDRGTARILTENDDVVTLTTIHQSKGLEYPVVFVAGLGRHFNLEDGKKALLMHKDLGLGLHVYDADSRLNYPTLAKTAVKRQLRREQLSEEMRLLYVAMTRARDKLILTAVTGDLEKAGQEWADAAARTGNTFPVLHLLKARSFLDWLSPVLMRHQSGAALWPKDLLHALDGEDEAPFLVRVVRGSEMSPGAPGKGDSDSLRQAVREGRPLRAGLYREEVDRRLSWSYPWSYASGKRAKVSVSEARNMLAKLESGGDGKGNRVYQPFKEEGSRWEEAFAQRPRFLAGELRAKGAERGTAYHLVLRHLDLTGDLGEEGIRSQIEALSGRGIIGPEQAGLVKAADVARFFRHELGQRVLSARRVLREVPFSLAAEASLIYPELKGLEEEKIIVQGVIDCLAEEEDGFLLIDYKTDYMGPGRAEELVSHYRPQLELYSRAVEEILGRPVKERYIFFLADGSIGRV